MTIARFAAGRCALRAKALHREMHDHDEMYAGVLHLERALGFKSLQRQPEPLELRLAQRQLFRHEELVELWRPDDRAGEHCVDLAAMVDLMLE
jgi:hypothetical protein